MEMETETTWHQWKNILRRAVNAGQAAGFSDNTINDVAYRVGDFVANHFDPGNREQRLLKELWEQGDEGEKRTLATLMARMADTEKR